MHTKYPKKLHLLINILKKLPGVGTKTAERLAFHLLKWEDASLQVFGQTVATLKESIKPCPECGFLLSENFCDVCDPNTRNTDIICIISSAKDIYLIEETNTYTGLYHVIDHLLSPVAGFYEQHLHLEKLFQRIQHHKIQEVIIALDSTLEGDATALFLKNQLLKLKVKVTRLAFGLPMGCSLEYIDESTLSKALTGRQCL